MRDPRISQQCCPPRDYTTHIRDKKESHLLVLLNPIPPGPPELWKHPGLCQVAQLFVGLSGVLKQTKIPNTFIAKTYMLQPFTKVNFTCDMLVQASFPLSVFALQLLLTGYPLKKLGSFWPVFPPPDHMIFFGAVKTVYKLFYSTTWILKLGC